jgi:hypothetical protein
MTKSQAVAAPANLTDDGITEALSRHLRPGQRVRVAGLGEGTIVGKETRNLTEVFSYGVKLDHLVVGDPYVDVAPDRVEAIP